MPSSYSSSLRLNLQATGENTNTWGGVLNTGALALIDSAIAGFTTIALTGNTTLTTANGSSDQARTAMIKLTGSASYQVTVPAVSKQYLIWNASSYQQTIASAGGGSSIILPAVSKVCVGTDGTNVFELGYSGYGLKDYIDQAVLAATGSLPATTGNEGKSLVVVGGNWVPTLLTKSNISDFDSAYTFTTKQTFSGSTSVLAALFSNSAEKVTVSATAATGTINYDVSTQSVLYYTSNAAANWTVNLRHSSGTSLDSVLSTGQSVTVAFAVTQGGTPYYNNVVQVDGTTSGVTTKWQSVAPSAGIASSVNVYTYTVIKTGSATFTVLASMTSFV